MKLTLFHRSTFDRYDGTDCDVAGVGVVSLAGGAKAGFIGSSWGEHPDAPDCLHVAVLDGPDDIDAKLTEWGLKRDENQTDFPPEPPPPPESDGVIG